MQFNSGIYYYCPGFKTLNQSRLVSVRRKAVFLCNFLLIILAFKSPAWFVLYIVVGVFWFFYEMPFQRNPFIAKETTFSKPYAFLISVLSKISQILSEDILFMISNWIASNLRLRSCLFHCSTKWLIAFQICRITRRRKIVTWNCKIPDSCLIFAGQQMPMSFLRMRKRATVYKQTNAELGDMASSHRSLRL